MIIRLVATSSSAVLLGMLAPWCAAAEVGSGDMAGASMAPAPPHSSVDRSLPVPDGPDTQSPPRTVGKDWPAPVADSMWFGSLLFDQLEYRLKDGDDTLRWDIVGWYGGDTNRLWVKTEGDWRTAGERGGEAEGQALYGRMIAPFWDVQAGLRYDQFASAGSDRSRRFGVLGLQGLSPYRFEAEPALFVSEDGDISARLTATRDILLTQRLILQPRLDVDAAAQAVDEFGVGRGLNSVSLGLRSRFEVRREFAPYVGVHFLRRVGETADLARGNGDHAHDLSVVLGIRMWL